MNPSLRSGPLLFFFFNDTATTEIYTLSLHDALPIFLPRNPTLGYASERSFIEGDGANPGIKALLDNRRSEEHTSELQSRQYLVCRLLLEKKKNTRSRARDTSGDAHVACLPVLTSCVG